MLILEDISSTIFAERKSAKRKVSAVKRAVRSISLFLSVLLLTFSFISEALSLQFLPGDVNSDGIISADDARTIMRICVGAEHADKERLLLADTDKNGIVTSEDARVALRIATGLNTPVQAKTASTDSRIVGYTSKNYLIYNIDGLTYIDGLLIVNKTYSLPSDYAPGELLAECSEAFKEMQSAARENGLNIYISSGYRSFYSQKSIYNRYVSRDGKKLADTYSARPGHSEHQSGLSIDLNTITQAFGRTKEGRWVAENCHKYGFILRYPQGKADKTGYRYEPWHLRYVGIEKATAITKSGLCLEEYYGITSQYK